MTVMWLCRKKKPVGGVSLFGGADLFGDLNRTPEPEEQRASSLEASMKSKEVCIVGWEEGRKRGRGGCVCTRIMCNYTLSLLCTYQHSLPSPRPSQRSLVVVEEGCLMKEKRKMTSLVSPPLPSREQGPSPRLCTLYFVLCTLAFVCYPLNFDCDLTVVYVPLSYTPSPPSLPPHTLTRTHTLTHTPLSQDSLYRFIKRRRQEEVEAGLLPLPQPLWQQQHGWQWGPLLPQGDPSSQTRAGRRILTRCDSAVYI